LCLNANAPLVAPPGYNVMFSRKQYNCLANPVAATSVPVAAPVPAPVPGVPSFEPTYFPTGTAFPTAAKTLRPTLAGGATAVPTMLMIATIKVVQKLAGVSAAVANTDIFKANFGKAVIAALGLDPLLSTVKVNTVTPVTARRQLLAESISVDYTVTAQNILASTLTTQIAAVSSSTATGATSLAAQLLVSTGVTVVPATPAVTDVSPTMAPVKAPNGASSLRASSGATLTVGLIVGFLVTMLA
jgi:hypothetical protein